MRAKADQNAKELLNTVFEVDSIDDTNLLIMCSQEIQAFAEDPFEVAPKLALH